jgi:hypothetical protein
MRALARTIVSILALAAAIQSWVVADTSDRFTNPQGAPPTSDGPPRTFTLATATIADINAAFDAGTLTSERLVELYLNRIAAYDQHGPTINSLITVNAKARETARALDLERKKTGRRSPLHGIPVIVKDLLNTADMPTTGG